MKCILSIVAIMFLTVGCLNGQDVSGNVASKVLYLHDAAHGVGCWYFSGGGVYCLPDSQYNSRGN